MPFISNLTSKPVTDVDGQIIGHLEDLLATISREIRHPEIVALLVKRSKETILIPFLSLLAL